MKILSNSQNWESRSWWLIQLQVLRKVETKEHRTFEIRGDKLDAAKHLKIIHCQN